MTARKASYSPKNFAYDASLLLPASGPSRGKLNERTVAAADAKSSASSSLPSNAAADIIKSNSINPGSSSLRVERAAMQSCWIQRLTPPHPTINYEEEQVAEPSHVWTHFTKDFRSCSRRLHKTRHHTRSSSWPHNERPPNLSPFSPPKLSPFSQGKPIESVEHYLLSRASTEENLRVPFVDATESNNFCLRAGNPLLNQGNRSMSGSTSEALVPRLQHRDASRTCDESYEGEIRDEGKLQGFPTQPFQRFSKDSEKVTFAFSGDFTSLVGKPSLHADFNREHGSLHEAVSLKGLGDAPCKGKLAASKFAHRLVHIRGSSPDAGIKTSLSPAHMGASADAEKLLSSPPLVKDVNSSTPRADLSKFSDNRLCKKASLRALPATLDREANVPAVAFGDTEKKTNQAELGMFYKENSEIACDMEVKTRRNFGFLHFGEQSKELNWPNANPWVSCGSYNGVGSDKFCVDNRGSGMLTSSKSIQRKTDVGASTSATNAVPFVLKHYNGSRPFITDLSSSDSIVADHPLNPKKDLASKLTQTRVASEDLTRPCRRETKLDGSWAQLPGPVKPLETGSSTANREPIKEEFFKHPLNLRANRLKIDGKEKFKYFSRPTPYLPVETNAQTHYSSNLPQQTQGSPRKSVIQTTKTHNQGGSPDRISLDRSIMPRKLQEESLHLSKGEMGRPALQIDKQDLNFQPELSHNAATGVSMFFGNRSSSKFCDGGRTSEASRPKQPWIQRWQSSSNLIAMSGNTMPPCFGNDGDLGSDPAKLPVISSHWEKKGINCYNGNSTKPSRKSSKHMDGLGNFDAHKGTFPAYRSHFSLRGRSMAPSVRAMAMVGNTASKHHPTSLENRGSFTVWQCPSADNFEQRRLADYAKETVDDNMDGVDVDGL